MLAYQPVKKFFFGKPTDPDNSAELERLVSRSCVYRYIQANVCPFVSKSQQLIKDKEGMNVHCCTTRMVFFSIAQVEFFIHWLPVVKLSVQLQLYLKRYIIFSSGYRQWTFRVHGQEYTTKSYIKLQLNLLSIIPVNISNICHSLISQL